MDASPIQSVIIPTYNRKDMLAEAINSVLNQTQRSLEVIVVDDCSTDGTEDCVRGMNDERIQYFRNETNSGQEYSRMTGFRKVRGKYVTFLDDDDYYTDCEFFAKAVKIFVEHENDNIPLAMVCANAKFLNVMTGESNDSNIGRPGRVKGIDYILKPEYRKPPSIFPAVFSVEALKRAGLADMLIYDSATYVQAALEGDACFIADVVGVYKVSPSNFTHRKVRNPKSEARYYRIMGENAKRYRIVKEKICDIAGVNVADKWHMRRVFALMKYYAVARPSIMDRLRAISAIMKESGFNFASWLKIFPRLIYHVIIGVTPLRKLYRFIKGKPN